MDIYYSHFYKVKNKLKHHAADSNYWLAVTESKDEYLFTDNDLKKANLRAFANPEDIPPFVRLRNKVEKPYGRFLFGFFLGIFVIGAVWLFSPFLT